MSVRRRFTPCNRHYGIQDYECCDGVVMDIDEYAEGWDLEQIYQPCDCNPRCCPTCKGTARYRTEAEAEAAGRDDCADCDGTGWRGAPMWPRRTKRFAERPY